MLDGSDSIPHVLVGSTMFEARVMDQVGSQDEAEGKALTELKSLVQQRPNLRIKEIFGWLVVCSWDFIISHLKFVDFLMIS